MAELLGTIRGRFLLSLNDTREVRAIFAGFPIERVETTYSVSAGAGKRVAEVIISNGPG